MTDNIEIIYNSLTSDLQSLAARRSLRYPGQQQQQQQHLKSSTSSSTTGSFGSDEQSHTAETYITHSISEHSANKSRQEQTKNLFDKARRYLNPGGFFRFFTYLYAERKLLTFFWVHCIATLVVWAHFAMQKFDTQTNTVPEGASRYWWKVMVPTLEFGAMHAILFQMALIPLTMSKYTVSGLSETVVSRFVPMNRMLRIHIHLGYIMVALVFLSTVLFLGFFGLLCSDGEQQFCDKMKSEIMITGYIIIGFLLIVGATSYFRHAMPYEVFYAIHHIVFLLYFITILHTFDQQQRSGAKNRSQSFKWFSSTLLYYFCDRAAMMLNHHYRTPLVASSIVDGGMAQDDNDDTMDIMESSNKMVILRLRRPVLFHFKPGQYAQLRLKELDNHWHPFSIASGPGSSCLEFYIEVFGEKSWSNKLWQLLQKETTAENRRIEFEVMGPYGTALAKTGDYSHAIAIGTGTGIVPVLSLFKQHVRQLLRLEPESFLRTLKERQRKIIEVDSAEDERKGSIAAKACRPCCNITGNSSNQYCYEDSTSFSKRHRLNESLRASIDRHCELKGRGDLRENMKDMKQAAFAATRSIYGVVLLSALPVIGVAILGLVISWNTCNFELMYGMVETLCVLTVIFQACFAFVAFFIWDGNQFFAFLDAALCIIAPFADWYWHLQFGKYEQLHPHDVTLICLLVGYMTARLWSMVVRPRHQSWRSNVMQGDGFGGTLDRLEMVFVTRSASLVSKIMPEIHVLWDTLVAEWGRDNAAKACRISIHVTDSDDQACELLKQEFEDLDLFQSGAVTFGRPDFCEMLEKHTLEMVTTRTRSYSLLAFCGSAQLAQELHQDKISNDMVAAITGNKQHQMDFVSESYGGCKSKKSIATAENTDSDDNEQPSSPKRQLSTVTVLSTRRSVAYTKI